MKQQWIKQTLCGIALWLGWSAFAFAEAPEPDSIFWGTVSIGGEQVTSSGTNIQITLEVDGEVLVTYNMGDDIAAGDNYVLRIPMDSTGNTAGTAQPGDSATIKVADVIASSVSIGDMGSVTEQNLSIDSIDCTTSQSGSILDQATFGNISACAQLSNNFVIASGHTVIWDGSNGPLSGSVTIQTGGTFRITSVGASITGQVVLEGGTFDVDASLDVATLVQALDSTIDLGSGAILTVINDFSIPVDKTLTLLGNGTLRMGGVFSIAGTLNAGSATIDVRGKTLILSNDLDLSSATFLTDAQTLLRLEGDVTLTTASAVTLGLDLNDHTLTLGNANTDLTVVSELTLDHANEQLVSNGADVNFLELVTMSSGALRSTGGILDFQNGGLLSGGELNITGTELLTSSPFETTGVNVVSDESTTSKPTADAGADQTVSKGDSVTLVGSGSFDIDGSIASYLWTQISGPTAQLSDANVAEPIFNAPAVNLPGETLVFELRVTDDDGLTNTARVNIEVEATGGFELTINKDGGGTGIVSSLPAGILCGTDCTTQTQTFGADTVVTLTAEPGGSSLFIGWTGACDGQRGDCEVTLSEATTVSATFNVPTLLTQAMVDTGEIFVENSPYRVSNFLSVSAGSVLLIDPGVMIFFDENMGLSVTGRIGLQGTESNPIVLTATEISKPWNGVTIESAHEGLDDFAHVELSYANTALNFECCENGSAMTLSNMTFKNNIEGVDGQTDYVVTLDGALFQNNEMSVLGSNKLIQNSEFLYNDYGLAGTSDVDVENSTFRFNEVALLAGTGSVQFSFIADNETGIQTTLAGLSLSNNTIRDNETGIRIDPITPPFVESLSIQNNNIYNNTLHNLNNGHTDAVDATNNWWNATTEAEILARTNGLVTVTPFLDAPVGTLLTGQKGDIDGNGNITANDVTRLRLCVTYQSFLELGAPEAAVASFLAIDFVDDCARITDMDGNDSLTANDVTRLRLCVTYQSFLELGAPEAAVASFLAIDFNTDCQIMMSEW